MGRWRNEQRRVFKARIVGEGTVVSYEEVGKRTKVYRGDWWPELLKEGVLTSAVKNGKGEEVRDYRGETLISKLHKFY